MVVFPASGDFFQLAGLPSEAKSWVRYDVPSEYRYYSADEAAMGYWYIHEKYLLGAIELAYKQLGAVDYSCLPGYLQMEIAKAKELWTVHTRRTSPVSKTTGVRESYAQLYLLPSAPLNVVHSVWRALAKTSHPDQGGDASLFRKYSEAYEAIKKEAK